MCNLVPISVCLFVWSFRFESLVALSLDTCKQCSQETNKAALWLFLAIETSPTNDENEREKVLPMQYKFSIPKEKVKREMKSFHGISD